MLKPWEKRGYDKKLQKLKESRVLDLGMIKRDGTFYYSPFATPNIDDYYFDFEVADLCCDFIETQIKLFQGSAHTESGEFMVLMQWQRAFVSNIFGWKQKANGYRRYKESLVYVPRGNGKTSFIGALCIMFMKLEADGGLQVIIGANSKDQAHLVFKFAEQAIGLNPKLREHFKVLRKAITARGDSDSLRYLSNDVKAHDGLNINFGICDEIHMFKDGDLPKVITSSQSKRKEPLYVEITTASSQGENYCNQRVEYAIKIASGEWEADHFLPCLFFLEEPPEDENEDPWFDWKLEDNWHRVNPSLGISKSLDFLRTEYTNAKHQPNIHENNFKRKDLNIVTTSKNKFLDLGLFKKLGTQDPSVADLYGQRCFAGLDMAYSDDMCALVLMFPDFNNYLLPYFWLPSGHSNYEKLARFARDVTFTDGNEIDFVKVRMDIVELSQTYNICRLAFDPHFATELIQRLGDQGIECIKFSQNKGNLSEPLKQISAGVKSGRFSHGNNMTFNWMVGNGEIKEDAANNIMLVKPTGQNRTINKIDGLIAWAMAYGVYIQSDPADSIQTRLNSGEKIF